MSVQVVLLKKAAHLAVEEQQKNNREYNSIANFYFNVAQGKKARSKYYSIQLEKTIVICSWWTYNPEQNMRILVKLDRARKVWYLLLRVFWLLLPKFNFWKGDWALGYVSTQIWDFSNISLFPKILSLKSSTTREATRIASLLY